jgi:AraC-like DNA-binding protein
MHPFPSPDEPRFFRSDVCSELELMSAHWVRHSFNKHFHDCYTIGINDRGAGAFHCRHNRQEALPGTLNLIEPGETHTGEAAIEYGWKYRDFYISVERMRELAEQVDFRELPEFTSPNVRDPQLVHQFGRAFEAMVMRAAQLEQEYGLLKAIRSLLARHTTHPSKQKIAFSNDNPAVARVRDYIGGHYAEEITSSRLSSLVSRSPYHVIRAFHQQMGMPPHAYQSALRVAEAQKQLHEGIEIAHVALACGFYDQSHMNRIFRRVLGTTPGLYRG